MRNMKLNQHNHSQQYTIRAYTDSSISINDIVYTQPLIISAEKLIDDWAVPCFSELDSKHFAQLKELHIEILLLGTGVQQRFPPAHILVDLYEQGIGIEIMTTPAACRTYNILLDENRVVAAALFIEA